MTQLTFRCSLVQWRSYVKDLKTHQTLLCEKSLQQQGSNVKFDRWHRRLGHPSCDVVCSILNSCNIRISIHKNYTLCNTCELGKGHKLPFSSFDSVYTAPLKLVVANVWG
ncbi:uncharacterized protein [Gossypium hirsutum]|uniref:Uncharacterized protein isoform X2 n=1 Tax=Gossypium hirsutum TaxID=3635 RepID=A0ABM2ZK18_GOSHI|nr:uncharacterized protein LOC107951755 isoform X2 [Gossypium hirsutum]